MDNSQYKYTSFSCIDPVAVTMSQPWYQYTTTCPCNPELSNTSGRGFTSCPFGVQFEKSPVNSTNSQMPLMQISGSGQITPVKSLPVGSMIPDFKNIPIATPPQFQPRALSRIGEQWRSAN